MSFERQPRGPRALNALPRSEWLQAGLWLGLAALLAIAPLLIVGPSCGHDFTFHLQSWMDAAAQMRHGTLFPRWALTPAWNAGEPRFIFYPPLSWLLGAGLEFLLPAGLVPLAFTWIALAAAGLGLYRLARDFAGPTASAFAATVYLAGPYALFTAFERAAYAELLAAAWLPLLLRAAIWGDELPLLATALPLALLWLTNAPAAVMGTYAFAFLALWRLLAEAWKQRSAHRGAAGFLRRFALRLALGAVLGFALAGFYLLPAALERRWVEIGMAVIPGLRPRDNFLFGHTGDAPHDAVLHTASLLAVALLLGCGLLLLVAAVRSRLRPGAAAARRVLPALAALAAALGLLLTPLSTPLWNRLPELAFLQFPWRLLALLSVIAALALALSLPAFPLRRRKAFVAALGLIVAGSAGMAANRAFRQACEANDLPARRLALFRSGHGFAPTDEYTPGDADNDVLRTDDPPFWLVSSPGLYAPGTTPNPAVPDYDVPVPAEHTLSGRAPRHLELRLRRPAILVLNLRAYPGWQVLRNGTPATLLDREDGLVALALPAGHSTIDTRWRRTPDVWAGDGLTLIAVLCLPLVRLRSRQAGSYPVPSRKLRS